MAWKRYPPGTRRANRSWIIKGRFGPTMPGKRDNGWEIATGIIDPKASERELRRAETEAERDIWAKIEASRVPRAGENVTFNQAADQYLKWRDPEGKRIFLRQNIDKLRPHFGAKLIGDITSADITSLANELHPTGKAASKNTTVVIPTGAIKHFAAENEWCPYIKVRQFPIPRPVNRDVSDGEANTLINNLPIGSYERLLMVWLFRQGNRITDALNIRWGNIDLQHQRIKIQVHKTELWKYKAIDDEVFEALANLPIDTHGFSGKDRDGNEVEDFVFPWRNRQMVYDRWLTRYTKRLGIRFSAHMARHTFGRWTVGAGLPLSTAMDLLDHQDPRSTGRYQHVDEATQRDALTRMRQHRVERGDPPHLPHKCGELSAFVRSSRS